MVTIAESLKWMTCCKFDMIIILSYNMNILIKSLGLWNVLCMCVVSNIVSPLATYNKWETTYSCFLLFQSLQLEIGLVNFMYEFLHFTLLVATDDYQFSPWKADSTCAINCDWHLSNLDPWSWDWKEHVDCLLLLGPIVASNGQETTAGLEAV